MKILEIIKSYLEYLNPPFTGVSRQDSPDEDFAPLHSEFAGAGEVTWTMKQTLKKFPLRDQDGSYSCVLQSNAKARGATYANQGGNFPILSALPYNRRSNFPNPGTIPFEGLQIAARGLPLESIYPSQKLSEEQMNVAPKPFYDPNYSGTTPVKLPIDIDAIAQAMDQGFGVVICMDFSSSEYSTYIPQTINGVYRSIGHQIASVDRTIINAQKVLVCEDSAFLSSSQDGQRMITEDFLKNHCYFSGYVRNVTPPKFQAIPKPTHTFTVDMKLGDSNNEILLLQKRLIFEGYLSPDCATGYFGQFTKAAVVAYQGSVTLPQTGYVGTLTRAKLNL